MKEAPAVHMYFNKVLLVAQERDDLRKRTRQERLRRMRFGQSSGPEATTASPFLHSASLGECLLPQHQPAAINDSA